MLNLELLNDTPMFEAIAELCADIARQRRQGACVGEAYAQVEGNWLAMAYRYNRTSLAIGTTATFASILAMRYLEQAEQGNHHAQM